jgi:hypothetical protein
MFTTKYDRLVDYIMRDLKLQADRLRALRGDIRDGQVVAKVFDIENALINYQDEGFINQISNIEL